MAEKPDEVSTLAKRVGSLKMLAMAAAALLAAGAAFSAYFGRFALASELARHIAQANKMHEETQKRLADHDTDIAVAREAQTRIEDDLHWLRDQSAATAVRVGAPVVPDKKGDHR